ncbi:Uncharacterised protein [Mycobacteroides abscessus subsp. abscessus]|nr:Uncharacterised protein [Mycobacteroides abscessus subsp. abscessus]
MADHGAGTVRVLGEHGGGDRARYPAQLLIDARAQVDHELAGGLRGQRVRQHVAPHRRKRRQAGQFRAAGEPVGGDEVTGPHHAEQRGTDRQSGTGLVPLGAGERSRVQRVVEDAGVALERGPGGGGAQCGVAGDLGLGALAEPERGAAALGVGGQRDQVVDQRGPHRRELGHRQRVEVERTGGTTVGLGFGRRQQHQHERIR